MSGFVAEGFEAVAEELRLNLLERGDHGAAFAAFVDGELVVDIWGGLADARQGRPWRADTIASIFSGSKGLVATCLLLLVERGQVELDRPVADYWPEFGSQEKSDVLVMHLVSHLAGMPGLNKPVTLDEATDAERMAGLLADQPTICPPGSRLYYHALSFGWLCGELIRRIDGRPVGRFFAEDVAGPLALRAWIGLPETEESDVAWMVSDGPLGGNSQSQGELDRLGWSIWENPPRLSAESPAANLRTWRAAEVPASNGVASAHSLAKLYGCLSRGGEIDGIRLLEPETIELGATRLSEGVEPYLEVPVAFGIGFELQSSLMHFGPPEKAFGHTGAGGSIHGAWPDLRSGFSYVTNTLHESKGVDPRAASLLGALHQAIADRRPKESVR